MLAVVMGFLVAFLVTAGGERTSPEEVRRPMAGGYQKSTTKSNGTNDERLQAAASFAVQGIHQAETPMPYTFLEKISYPVNNDGDVQTVVLNASQQVVAGINYRMTIGLMNTEGTECLGAFKCVVYDRFGDLSVTTWGDEVSCDEALALSETKKKELDQEEEPEQ